MNKTIIINKTSVRIAILVAVISLFTVCRAIAAENTMSVDVKKCGAIGDGVTDDTDAFQKVLNQMGAQGGGTVKVPVGNYLIKMHLIIPDCVTLEGISVLPPIPVKGASPSPEYKKEWLKGSVLLAVEGAGQADGPAFITLGNNSTIKGLAVFYPDQKIDDVPVPYPWTIASAGGQNMGIVDCMLVNPYQAVDFGTRAAHRHFIRNLYGEPLYKGLFIDQCGDVGRCENIHFWAFTERISGMQNKKLAKWKYENAIAFILGRSDWEYMSNCFAIGYKIGFHFMKMSKVGPGNYLVTQSGADCGNVALQIDETQSHSGVSFLNSQMFGRILVGEKNVGPVRFTACGFFGSSHGYWKQAASITCEDQIRIAGTGRISFDNCHFKSIDAAAKADRFIHAVGGRLAINNSVFMDSPKTSKNPQSVVLEKDVISAIITGNEFYGMDPIINRAGSEVIIKDNLVGTAMYTHTAPKSQK